MAENIHPEFSKMLKRSDKEELLQQKGVVVWLYGLSGSGKSTIANALERRLHAEGKLTKILDGDNVRVGLNKDLGFSDEDRNENIRRIAELAKLFCDNATITLCAFISPKKEYRDKARSIIGTENFIEVYVKASFEECQKRDVKGLYAKAADGKVKNFTGKDSSFEEPDSAELILDTEKNSLEECVGKIYSSLSDS